MSQGEKTFLFCFVKLLLKMNNSTNAPFHSVPFAAVQDELNRALNLLTSNTVFGIHVLKRVTRHDPAIYDSLLQVTFSD